MRSTNPERKDAAFDRLSRLAQALKKIGLAAELAPDRRPFSGLALRLPPGVAVNIDSPRLGDVIIIPAGTVMVLVGSAHYWRQRSNEYLQFVGPLEKPVVAAGKILDHVMGHKRYPLRK